MKTNKELRKLNETIKSLFNEARSCLNGADLENSYHHTFEAQSLRDDAQMFIDKANELISIFEEHEYDQYYAPTRKEYNAH